MATHQTQVGEFYNDCVGLWEQVLGEHVHHGFYDPGTSSTLADHPAAQIRLIEEILRFAGVSDEPGKRPKRIIDVGCGYGGSSRYLGKKYGAEVKGITISSAQAKRAQDLADAQGLGDKVTFQVADALDQPFPDGQFDLVWSLESGEHIPNKEKLVSELARVAAPGATIIIATWCHRELLPGEKSLPPAEIDILEKLCEGFYLAPWCPPSTYVKLAQSLSLKDIKTDDWSENVEVFWSYVIKAFFSEEGINTLHAMLQRGGSKTIIGAQALPLMMEGFSRKLIKFPIMTCRKPE